MNKRLQNLIKFLIVVLLAWFVWKYILSDEGGAVLTLEPTATATATEVSSGGYYTAYFTNPPLEANHQGIESSLLALIGGARTSVHGAFFELDLPELVEALLVANSRGVEVELVYDDDQMTDPDREGLLSRLRAAGIPMVPDERSAFMHNKFFVIDGAIVWTGSFNFTENASHKNNENAVVFVVPQIAANYEREFSEMFAGEFGVTSPSDTPYPEVSLDGVSIHNYFAPEDGVMAKVIAEVRNAESSIDFLAFSFTDVNLAYTMSELAMEEDLIVRGVFESRQSTGSSVCPYLMSRSANIPGNGVIDIRLDGNSATMHEKLIIIDSRIVIFGSFNFSGNADENNDENLLIVYDPVLAAEFEREFERVYSQGIVPEDGCRRP
ncbi:hypothetical protein A2V61_02685 [Candidatus Woesebacteria bacterium RBG_19FT_COMBO_47_8]|nr:MAG: hypothetical protein A2V61_02685 [Candidatus Woesebacteria bacterium RBG_19FT_COMBO_47_8]